MNQFGASPKPNGLFFSASQRTWAYLYRLDPAARTIARLAPVDQVVMSSASLSKDGSAVAFMSGDSKTVPEVYVADVGPALQQPGEALHVAERVVVEVGSARRWKRVRLRELDVRVVDLLRVAGQERLVDLEEFGPGFGLMATLIAQVAMFRNLGGDASVIGSALAIALTGTLYGCMLQNLVRDSNLLQRVNAAG